MGWQTLSQTARQLRLSLPDPNLGFLSLVSDLHGRLLLSQGHMGTWNGQKREPVSDQITALGNPCATGDLWEIMWHLSQTCLKMWEKGHFIFYPCPHPSWLKAAPEAMGADTLDYPMQAWRASPQGEFQVHRAELHGKVWEQWVPENTIRRASTKKLFSLAISFPLSINVGEEQDGGNIWWALCLRNGPILPYQSPKTACNPVSTCLLVLCVEAHLFQHAANSLSAFSYVITHSAYNKYHIRVQYCLVP